MSNRVGWQVLVDSAAAKELRKLPAQTRSRILDALSAAAAEFPSGRIKKLAAAGDRWRLRVGDWRVILRPVFEKRQIVVLRIARRDAAYGH